MGICAIRMPQGGGAADWLSKYPGGAPVRLALGDVESPREANRQPARDACIL